MLALCKSQLEHEHNIKINIQIEKTTRLKLIEILAKNESDDKIVQDFIQLKETAVKV